MASSVVHRVVQVLGRLVLPVHDTADQPAGVPDGTLRLQQDGTNLHLEIYSLALNTWQRFDPRALLAPHDADYLVGTANGELSAEIVVGTSPGGELGGSWAAPTVDATHSGSAHHAQNHSAQHAENAADELLVENLGATSVDVSTALRPDGLGGLAFSDVAHVDTTGRTANDHHAQSHGHTGADGSGTVAHSATTGRTANDHHNESHTVASHSDTTATGAELETLTDGSNADSLHSHGGGMPTAVAVNTIHHWHRHGIVGAVPVGANLNIQASQVGYYPLLLEEAITIKRLLWRTGTAGGNGNYNIGIYNSTSEGKPGTRLVQLSSTAYPAASTDVASNIADQALSRGLYYVGFIGSNATDTFIGAASLSVQNNLITRASTFSEASTGVTLPATATPVKTGNMAARLLLVSGDRGAS